jgi:dethiobiotin synthetase
VLLIEGVGGVMVPLDDRHTVLDWIAALEAPALLVVGSYLGAISHALTAEGAIRGRGLAVAGVVIDESADSPVPLDDTAQTMKRFLPHRLPLATVKRDAGTGAVLRAVKPMLGGQASA